MGRSTMPDNVPYYLGFDETTMRYIADILAALDAHEHAWGRGELEIIEGGAVVGWIVNENADSEETPCWLFIPSERQAKK